MARIGWFDVRLVNREQMRLEKRLRRSGRDAAEAMQGLGEEKRSLEFSLDNGIKIYSQFWREVPELKKGEVIIASVPDVDFFDVYVAEQVGRGLCNNHDAMNRGFERLLKSVSRRAPFDDLHAEKNGNYLSTRADAECGDTSPQRLEANHISSFKGEMGAAIGNAADLDALMRDVKWLIGKYSQLLPYTLQTLFFADNESSPNFGRHIQERFSVETRSDISDYVRESTNNPIFTMLKLVTIDATGMIKDYILSKASAPVRFNAAHYLAASKYFDIAAKNQAKAEKQQAALEKRINEGKIKISDLNKGISLYLEHIIETPQYRVSVEGQGSAFALEETNDAGHVVATVVAAHERFTSILTKLSYISERPGANVSLCNDFKFPYP